MNFDQFLMTSLFAAIPAAITWVGCAIIAHFHTGLRKEFGGGPLSAVAASAALGALVGLPFFIFFVPATNAAPMSAGTCAL